MALSLSSTLSNFLSFLLPTKPPPLPPQPQLNLPPSPTPFPSQTLKTKPSHNSPIVSQQQDAPPPSPSSSCDELSSVICPSLAYSNTLFFRSAYNVEVVVNEDEGEEKLLNRFRREVMTAGVIQECKRRRFFENKHDEIKRKSREAAKRNSGRRLSLCLDPRSSGILSRPKAASPQKLCLVASCSTCGRRIPDVETNTQQDISDKRRHPLPKSLAKSRQDVPTTKKEEDEDNWDLPEEDYLY